MRLIILRLLRVAWWMTLATLLALGCLTASTAVVALIMWLGGR